MIVSLVTAIGCDAAIAQEAENKAVQLQKSTGTPPRATPEDYQARTKVGDRTLAGEFTGHSVPTPDGVFETEDYVVVEVGMFGPPEARGKLVYQDFSLRINGKKATIAAEPFEVVLRSLKDPEWIPPESSSSKSKTGLSTGGGAAGDNSPPPPVHMPFELKRAMELKVQKAALPEGERPLPEAGLIFFPYHGKDKGIHSVELLYAGSAGNAVLQFQQ